MCDAIYEMDWSILPVDTTKDLLLIMTRSGKPVKMTSAHIVVLSVESFTAVSRMTLFQYVTAEKFNNFDTCVL